jgi:[FeFe] hydrogenase H-cluster maturation GTPase HydF
LLVNSLFARNVFTVSDIAGTTRDSVKTKYELLPYGPVVLVDTAGIDDEGELGKQKISETIKILSSSDFALVIVDARETLHTKELELLAYLDKLKISYVIAVNKIEFGVNPYLLKELKELRLTHFEVSSKEKAGLEELKRKIIRSVTHNNQQRILDGIISAGDVIVLIVPADLTLPKGKLILSHVQMIREAIDEDVTTIICKEKELRTTIDNLKSYPNLVIVDNYSFSYAAANVPEKVKLTTFSVILASYKGDLTAFVRGLHRIEELKNGDRVLIIEACSHHSEEDMSKVRIPRWLQYHTNKNLQIDINKGQDLPGNISDYKLIIHCNGTMITHRAMQTRINEAKIMDVPIVNYGTLISYMHGAVPRALEPFKEAMAVWEKFTV